MSLIVVEGKSIRLPSKIKDLSREVIMSIIRDLDKEIAEKLERFDWDFQVREEVIIIFRKSAIFG